ncbi:AbrB/MazE/SpoVT family DNA-binding domain-containing protein [Radiobacillus sp. PE A8.2]|uniref:AbrB/MazE/SpoVT family DNA-binding domain-containing protein n=1 Tax=Radiobacillus sp. PE A8.2 TaxID=3380349 RepID=UPI00388DB65F
MKSTGVVRKTDQLGRIVIPKELRDRLKIANKDPLEIFVEEEKIILQKYYPSSKACMITGEITSENKEFFDGKIILSPEAIDMLLKELD